MKWKLGILKFKPVTSRRKYTWGLLQSLSVSTLFQEDGISEVTRAVKHSRSPHTYFRKGEGGHQEDMTPGWPSDGTQILGGSSPPPVLGRYILPTVTTWAPFSRTPPWGVRCCWDHLDGLRDWAQFRPLYKLLRFGRGQEGGSEMYSFCRCPTPASYVSSCTCETCHLPIQSDLPLSLLSPSSLGTEAS